jgi:hypothetical protein
MGYVLFRSAEMDAAARHLERAAASRSRDFPVECLNSHVVLAELYARSGEARAVARIVHSALELHDELAGDFEVRINFRLRPWLVQAGAACAEGALQRIRAYEFAC